MAESPHADPVTRLGERILAELGDDRTTNTLTRWLTHHVASLMEAADRAREDSAPDADVRAAAAREAILDLWKHRAGWPNGWPPPGAAAIVRLLNDLPDMTARTWGGATVVQQLHDLHHHVLGVIADLVAVSGTEVDRGWLDAFGEQLTADETLLLTRAASAGHRIDDLKLMRSLARGYGSDSDDDENDAEASGKSEGQTPQPHPLVWLADTYRETLLELVARLTKSTTGSAPG
ncbi:hypothetical protein [Crossiella sp. CA198]|uniref:hypothetical protein n=1 Tax=Crossiella sp. CA198 TaxID=3455607 RepID=UPI003F8D137A